MRTGPPKIDLVSRGVTLDGRDIALVPQEYRLLHLLASHLGLVITYDQLINDIRECSRSIGLSSGEDSERQLPLFASTAPFRERSHVSSARGEFAVRDLRWRCSVQPTDIARMQMAEAQAPAFYWELRKDVPIAFARRNPKRLGPGARWRPGRHDPWLVFGPRASLLTGQPYRATTPGNCVLNWLYAVCQTEPTIALRTSGIDPGIGLFLSICQTDRR